MESKLDIKLKPADKVVGGILAGAVVTALGVGLYYVLPYLIELAKNTLYLGVLIVALVLFVLVFGDKNTWIAISYGWKNISRNIRKAIIRENPIGVLDTVISRLETKMEEIDTSMNAAIAARKRQDNAIADMEKRSAESSRFAEHANRVGKSEGEVARHATAAERWRTAADEMRPMAAMLGKMQVSLEQARDLCANKLEDIKNQKEVLTLKLDAMQHGQATVKSFKRFFGANPDLAMHQLTVDEIERQSTEAEAEIEQYLRVVNPMLQEQQLKRDAEQMRAMEKFGKFLQAVPPTPQLGSAAVDEPATVRK